MVPNRDVDHRRSIDQTVDRKPSGHHVLQHRGAAVEHRDHDGLHEEFFVVRIGMRQHPEGAHGVEIRAEAAGLRRGLPLGVERAAHAVHVAEPRGDPQCPAWRGTRGDEIHRRAVPVADERVLQHRNAVGRHPVGIGAAVEEPAHLVGLHL